MLTEVNDGNRLNDIIEVKVDLNKLSRFYGSFDINNIQKEACIQMRVEGTMVVSHKNGTPVKDTLTPEVSVIENVCSMWARFF